MIGQVHAQEINAPDALPEENEEVATFQQSDVGVLKWLLKNGLIQFNELKDINVYDLSRRNINFQVSVAGGRSLFVKMGVDHDHRNTLQHEWDVIAAIRSDSSDATRDRIPRPIHCHRKLGIYIYEFIDGTTSLRRLLETKNTHRIVSSIIAAGRLVLALGDMPVPSTVVGLRAATPLPFSFGRPRIQLAAEFSSTTFEFLRLLQSSPLLLQLLERCLRLWSPDTLSHFDIRLDNFLIVRRSRAFILDFEFACLGDPAWDFSCLVGQLLAASVFSVNTTKPIGELAFDERLMKNIEAAITALNEHALRALSSHKQEVIKSRLDGFAVAHILQMLYELTLVQPKLSRHVVLGLQLCENIARRPDTLTRFFV